MTKENQNPIPEMAEKLLKSALGHLSFDNWLVIMVSSFVIRYAGPLGVVNQPVRSIITPADL